MIPLRHLTTPVREGGIFVALRRTVPKPKARDARKNARILETMWILVNKIFSARRDPARYQTLILRLDPAINASLKRDQRRRTEEAGKEVKHLLGSEPPLQ